MENPTPIPELENTPVRIDMPLTFLLLLLHVEDNLPLKCSFQVHQGGPAHSMHRGEERGQQCEHGSAAHVDEGGGHGLGGVLVVL